MSTSQNGWQSDADRHRIGVKPLIARGVSFPGGVRAGDVATVLGYVAEQFHDRIERLVPGWCWGYAFRAISGSASTSNHGSGTAIDCNAPNHPLGVRGTFSPTQIAEGKRILAEVDNVVRWGELYSGRVDGMHFEINANAAAVARVAAKLRGISDMALSDADKKWLRENLTTRNDTGYARDQIMTALGFDPTFIPNAADSLNNEIARRVDVGHARDQLVEKLDAILAILSPSSEAPNESVDS